MTSISPLLLNGLLALDLLLLVATLWLLGWLLQRARVHRPDDPILNRNQEEPSESRPERSYFSDRSFLPERDYLSERSSLAEWPVPAPVPIPAPTLQWVAPVLDPPPLLPFDLPAMQVPEVLPHLEQPSFTHPELEALPPLDVRFRETVSPADLFADPLDGTLFLDGEEILICRCGVGYHMETWDWIQGQHAGKCVHCGERNGVEKQIVPPRR